MKIFPTQFDGQDIRRVYDEATETWWFSVVDVVQVLTQQADDLTARKYWNQLKRRLRKEGSQLVTSCHQLKMPAGDGRQRLTDVSVKDHKKIKGLKSHNLRDHMTEAELIFTALAEMSTRQIAENTVVAGLPAKHDLATN